MFDPEDYWVGAGTLPHDIEQSYLRVSEVAFDGTVKPEGPIFIVPPPDFSTTPRPVLSVSGTAPNVAALATGLPPTGSIHFVLPMFADYVDILSLEGAGGDNLKVAMHAGMSEQTVFPITNRNFWDAAFKDIFVRGDGSTVEFEMSFAMVNGEMA